MLTVWGRGGPPNPNAGSWEQGPGPGTARLHGGSEVEKEVLASGSTGPGSLANESGNEPFKPFLPPRIAKGGHGLEGLGQVVRPCVDT